jgi:hypothetical protein
MDLPDVDWFCKECWMEDANSTLHNQGNIPLIYTKVFGDQRNQSKVGDLSVGGSPTAKEKIVEALRKLGIVWGRLNRCLNVVHEPGEFVE